MCFLVLLVNSIHYNEQKHSAQYAVEHTSCEIALDSSWRLPTVSSAKGIIQAGEPRSNSGVNTVAALHAHSYGNLCALTLQAPWAPRLWWAFDSVIYIKAGKLSEERRWDMHQSPLFHSIYRCWERKSNCESNCLAYYKKKKKKGNREDYKPGYAFWFLSMVR